MIKFLQKQYLQIDSNKVKLDNINTKELLDKQQKVLSTRVHNWTNNGSG